MQTAFECLLSTCGYFGNDPAMKTNYGTRSYDVGRDILKLIAIITMTIDHIGAVLFPGSFVLFPGFELLRIIGRLSFPIFGYLIVLGVETTRNLKKYFIRLFAFAIISQIPFYLALGYSPFESLNIFFTLSFGVLSLTNPLFMIVSFVLSLLLNFDYSAYGIALIVGMRFLRENTKMGILVLILINLVFLPASPIQLLSLLALPIIIMHKNGSLGASRVEKTSKTISLLRKYAFYIYYPAHLLLLYVIKTYFLL